MLKTFDTIRRWHAPLAWFAVAMAALAVVSTTGLVLDDRVVGGMPIWAKPLKFSISFVAYAVTVAWLIFLLPRVSRVARWAGTMVVVASALEMAIIVGQVLRGRASHFNVATPFDAAVFSVMGILVAIIYAGTLVVSVVLVRTPLSDRAAALAVRLGLGISIAGMSVGFLMLGPGEAQRDAAAAGRPVLISGAHAVGVADGGPGLPLVGWSTTGGDLRVAHFLGMHGLQVMALVAIVLATGWGRGLDDRTRLRSVWLVATAYLALCALSLWQAIRGQPVTGPDVTTLVGLTAVAALVALGGIAIRRGRRHSARPRVPTHV